MVATSRELFVFLAAISLQAVYKFGYDYFNESVGEQVNLIKGEGSKQRSPVPSATSVVPGKIVANENSQKARHSKHRDPQLGFLGHYEEPGHYAFRVGDIVVHRGHGQLGVVLERFEVCQMSDEWFAANAPPGMTRNQPFYTILVSQPGRKFTRHGAQSSHRRWDTSRDGAYPPPVQHPDVTRLFGKLDRVAARYEARDPEALNQEVNAKEWDKE
eukprot:TRINITY_DN39772_c0_g1_i1.p1 TRINITY_DN39772_c0_g1~~TRINITY_DN39772_c0_g1_i1.p1  ORF type:complete len:215 (+),score=15.39 TRINITY_DN39772_c0_g1_i1:43-687(+)